MNTAPMPPTPSILTNLAFQQSPLWLKHSVSICAPEESPDVLPAWRQAWRLFRQRRAFDVVVTMGARPSLAYGLLCALCGVPSRQIMAEYFLDYPRPSSWRWRLKLALYRRVARRALGILTNSSAEVPATARRFGLPQDRIRFVPMYTTIDAPALSPIQEGFVLSTGRTLRDNATLLAAMRRLPAPLVLVTGADDPLPAHLPENVTVSRDIPLAETHDLMRRCALVAVPLLPAERSTGQVVFFEAMALGKPVIATRLAGTVDYIRDGENGLLVEPGDAEGLACAIQRLLEDPALARRLAETALADILARWMPDHHARHMLDAIADLSA